MTDKVTCPTCLAHDLDEGEMCAHVPALCDICCRGGEHDWMPREAA